MKNLIECKLTKEQLKVLNDTFCVYENGTKDGEIPVDCNECILRNIEWVAMKSIIRDLCFAIYHDKILTKNPKHYHHNF